MRFNGIPIPTAFSSTQNLKFNQPWKSNCKLERTSICITIWEMACATTNPTFSFHNLTQSCPSPRPYKPHNLSFSLNRSNTKKKLSLISSIDVSKEDKPSSDETSAAPVVDELIPSPTTPEERFDKLRLEEKFAVLNTGIYECKSCGFKYDESVGDPSYPIPPGFQFDKLPDDWRCPTCGAAQSFFESKSVEIAGFAENQQFGLGGNTLTSGQKALLIWGSLAFFFALFLSGYFLQ